MDGSEETELKVVCSDRDALASISSTSSNDESKQLVFYINSLLAELWL